MTTPCRALSHFVRCNSSAKGSIKLPITLEFRNPSFGKDLQIRASCKTGKFAAAWLDLDHLAHEKGTGWLRVLPISAGLQVAQVYLTNRSKIWFAGTEIEGILFRPPNYNRSAIAPLAPLLCTPRDLSRCGFSARFPVPIKTREPKSIAQRFCNFPPWPPKCLLHVLTGG
jgi:hypothetical protein